MDQQKPVTRPCECIICVLKLCGEQLVLYIHPSEQSSLAGTGVHKRADTFVEVASSGLGVKGGDSFRLG